MSREKKQHWAKWYWGDWRKDARLRRCSYAARGLWADMLSLMGDECDVYGYLIMEGQPLTASDLCGLLGGAEREVAKLLQELGSKHVFSRVGDPDLDEEITAVVSHSVFPAGTIFSRRMVRDKARNEIDRANGARGGNPALKPQERDGLTPPDKAKKLEARDNSLETTDCSLRSDRVEGLNGKTIKPSAIRSRLKESPDFDQFYAAFPLRRARAAAVKAYAKAREKADAATILAGAKRYAAARQGEDERYTKHPATWLNGECWADDLPLAGGSRGQNGSDLFVPCGDIEWDGRLKHYLENPNFAPEHRWLPKWGPPPTDPQTRVPTEILAAHRSCFT